MDILYFVRSQVNVFRFLCFLGRLFDRILANPSQMRVILRIFYCACTKRPYFHFQSKIWRHHRVSPPRFPARCGNLGYSRTFNAVTRLLLTSACILKTSSPKGFFWGWVKWWKGWWCDVYPQRSRFYFCFFCVCANFGENSSRNVSVRVYIYADEYTDTRTEAN